MASTDRRFGNGVGTDWPEQGRSSAEQLRDLLSEIEDTAQEADGPRPMTDNLARIKRFARHIDEPTAQLILDAIVLGEDFASLYIRNLFEFPDRARPCEKRTHPCS